MRGTLYDYNPSGCCLGYPLRQPAGLAGTQEDNGIWSVLFVRVRPKMKRDDTARVAERRSVPLDARLYCALHGTKCSMRMTLLACGRVDKLRWHLGAFWGFVRYARDMKGKADVEEYLRKLQHMSGHRSHGGLRKFKKLIVIAAVAAVAVFIIVVVLLILAIGWLLNRGDNIRQAGESVTQQVQPFTSPLNLESYISNNQVNAEQLQKSFNALPAQLQDAWLGQFKSQLEELQNQAGISNETIQTLTTLYNTLQLAQGA